MLATLIDTLDLLFGIIGVFGGAGGAYLAYRWYITGRWFRKIFPLSKDETIKIVCPIQPDRQRFQHPEIHDDLMAAVVVASTFSKFQRKWKIYLSSQIDSGNRNAPMFLICGPVGNIITADLLNMKTLPYRFEKNNEDKYQIVDVRGHVMHGPQGESRDYALIAKVTNPWPSTKKAFVYVAAGIGRLGTQGAARFLCEEAKLIGRKLKDESKEAVCFAAVVECEGDHRGLETYTTIIRLSAI